MLNDIQPARGRLLISEPFLTDPNFQRSVVLLAEHEAEGTIGFILNQKSNLVVKDVIPDIWEGDFPVHYGGPVATDSLYFIHRCYDKMNSGDAIGQGIYWGGNFETLKILLNANAISQAEIRFFIGYSGWDEGQLDNELAQNSWIVANEFTADMLFSADEDLLWKQVLTNMGSNFAHLVNFPVDPSLN